MAMEIGDKVWEIVDKWDYFNKDTLGKQFVKAADSMALNIAEGYGRFFYKENKNFKTSKFAMKVTFKGNLSHE